MSQNAIKTFGYRLASLMLKNEMSQLELAKRLGVSFMTVNAWVNGKKYPHIYNVIALADFFGVTTDYLLKGE